MRVIELEFIVDIVHNCDPLGGRFGRVGPINRASPFDGIVTEVDPLITQIIVHVFVNDLEAVEGKQIWPVYGGLSAGSDVVPVGAGM